MVIVQQKGGLAQVLRPILRQSNRSNLPPREWVRLGLVSAFLMAPSKRRSQGIPCNHLPGKRYFKGRRAPDEIHCSYV